MSPLKSEHLESDVAQWLSGRMWRPSGRGFESHRRHCVVFLSKNINPSLVLVQPRKTRPYITERLMMGRKESNQTKSNETLNQTAPSTTMTKQCTLSAILDSYIKVKTVSSGYNYATIFIPPPPPPPRETAGTCITMSNPWYFLGLCMETMQNYKHVYFMLSPLCPRSGLEKTDTYVTASGRYLVNNLT